MACIEKVKRHGRYVIDFYDNQGNRQRKTLPQGTTKARAGEILRDIEDKLFKGLYLPVERIPLFSKVADTWLISKRPNIRHSTCKQYEGHLKNHLKPFFEGVKINRVNFDLVEKFISHSLEEKVTIPTLKKILINLGAIMTYAVRKKYIDYNPVRDVEKPKGQSVHDEGKEMDILMPVEIRALLEATADLKHVTLFMAAVTTGLRQGELLGLKWTDIDWFSQQIHVNRTYNHFRFYDPKTKGSKRKVDTAPETMQQLKRWKLACPANDLDLVFPNESGKPMSSLNMYTRKFLPALRKAGIKRIRFHNLRHTYASIQIDLGANPKYIQSQMGHASINVTMDTYGHLMKDVNKEAASRLGNAIFGKDLQKRVSADAYK